MKYFLYPLLICMLLASCKSNNKAPNVKDTANKSVSISSGNPLVDEFKPIIQGVWIKKDYLEKIVRTKSVAAADDRKKGITEMYINTDSLRGDSIVLLAGYFNHDSGSVIIRFKQGKHPSTIQFNNGELGYSIAHGDTTITISEYDESEKRIVTTTFNRVLKRQPENNLEYGMTYAIDKGIISGKYMMTDTAGKTSNVTFTDDGSVSGFLNFTKYQADFDLNEDPMANLDGISFDIRTKNYKSFSFKIDKDTLGLYLDYPNADSTVQILGKRIYKLVKQK
jgi:hypothetical protein